MAEKGLHQALSALEVLLNSAGAENIRQTGNKASGAGFSYHSSVEDGEGEHEEAGRILLPNSDSEEFQSYTL
uniref:Uncharacterized protein n=1 Tax=Candidatus Kentrum eta TaxID=2126337 RepID=A0A450VEH0_9GAMM|nr:MAG: hypothetical protein BECKH772B_GA0070898_103331 [Candidatus Kentron sp. H]VFK03470.1 MAG: hypothetical protein BECKH772A_GA0070896_103281 [Candidatus Kentron sp. H]VFK06081.1 MAG: hypothetical protein BECKH772C_GA0070978_103251 [Candidatus Kentron sp. H]